MSRGEPRMEHRRQGTILAAVVAGLIAASPLPAQTQWQVKTRVDPATGAERKSAFTENEEGFQLVVSSGSGSRSARCSFRLPEGGPVTLDAEKLPTLMVEGREPQSIAPWPPSEADVTDGGDFMEAARRGLGVMPLVGSTAHSVDFRCWTALRDQASPTRGALRQMIDGDRLVIGFQLASGGAAAASFSLAGADRVLPEVLGVSPRPTEKDLLQEDLLRFRVQYRRSTCFLLAGRKKVRGCIETVNQCALKSQESVLSMVGCIEGE